LGGSENNPTRILKLLHARDGVEFRKTPRKRVLKLGKGLHLLGNAQENAKLKGWHKLGEPTSWLGAALRKRPDAWEKGEKTTYVQKEKKMGKEFFKKGGQSRSC